MGQNTGKKRLARTRIALYISQNATQTEAKSFFSPFLSAAIIAAVLALGLFFRFVNLDQKLYLADEVITRFAPAKSCCK